jgi:hypothetical protein
MTEPIVSGLCYQVVGIDDAAPSSEWDFTGPCTITVRHDAYELHLTGTGVSNEDHVRFYEKGPDGGELRIWRIVQSNGEFSAEHDPMI